MQSLELVASSRANPLRGRKDDQRWFMLKKTVLAGVLSAFALITSASAQEIVTVVMRDGQRLVGEVPELDSRGFTLRANGKEQVIPQNSVAAIEYAPGDPPADAKARLDAGQPLVVLRNGQIIDGRLVDIGGDSPKRLTLQTPGGQRDLLSIEVAKVYLYWPTQSAAATAAPPPAESAAANTAPSKGTIIVPATQAWTSTGLRVRRGDRLEILGFGDIGIGNNASSGVGGSPAATIRTIKYPLQSAPVGALIARIDNAQPFPVVNVPQPIVMPANGTLFLGINDDHVEDNAGNYTVSVVATQPSGTKR